MQAAIKNRAETVLILVKADADVDSKDNQVSAVDGSGCLSGAASQSFAGSAGADGAVYRERPHSIRLQTGVTPRLSKSLWTQMQMLTPRTAM